MKQKINYDMLQEKIAQLEAKVVQSNFLENNGKLNKTAISNLFETIQIPFFYKDIHGKYQYCNHAFEENIFGLKKENIIGKSLYDFVDKIPARRIDRYRNKDVQLFRGEKRQDYESKVKCADGIARYYHFHKVAFIVDDKVLGLFGLMLDINNYESTLETLDKLNDALSR